MATIQYERPWLADYQLDGIFAEERYACIEASTKSGKTYGCLIWTVEQALEGEPGNNYWWVAPVNDQSDIAFRRLKLMIPRDHYTTNETRSTISLSNGTTIWCKSAERPDLLYGEDVWAAVIDEASRVKDESWHAVRSTLSYTGGPIRIIGNVKGRKNWFYKLARRAEAGQQDMHYTKVTAWDAVEAGILPLSEIQDAQAIYPENVFRELYEAEAADDGGNPFGLAHIGRCVYRNAAGQPTDDLPDTEPVAWGWDLAKAYNWSVGIALDRDGKVCRFERFQAPWEFTFHRMMATTGRQVPALVDSTPGSGGDPILERLHERGYRNFDSFPFTVSSKQQLMIGLGVAIQERDVEFPDGPIVEELESFEYEYGAPTHGMDRVYYRAAEGFHDDCVDSLALAVYCKMTHAVSYTVAPPSVVRSSNYFGGAG